MRKLKQVTILTLVVLALALPTGVPQRIVADVAPLFYPTTQAVIDSGEVTYDIVPNRNSRIPPTKLYAYRLNYRYAIGSDSFTGSGNIVDNTSEQIVEEFGKEYRAGLSMPVRYDAQHPEVSMIKPEKLLINDIMSAVGKVASFVLTIVVGVWLLHLLFQRLLNWKGREEAQRQEFAQRNDS